MPTTPPRLPPTLLSPADIAALLGVKRETVYVWINRHRLPLPIRRAAGSPLWHREEIAMWALTTGRLRDGPLLRDICRMRAWTADPTAVGVRRRKA
jgi:predicted DNA-binding transcriptional regulator AlpA